MFKIRIEIMDSEESSDNRHLSVTKKFAEHQIDETVQGYILQTMLYQLFRHFDKEIFEKVFPKREIEIGKG